MLRFSYIRLTLNINSQDPAAISRDYAVAAEQIFNKLFLEIPYCNNAEFFFLEGFCEALQKNTYN